MDNKGGMGSAEDSAIKSVECNKGEYAGRPCKICPRRRGDVMEGTLLILTSHCTALHCTALHCTGFPRWPPLELAASYAAPSSHLGQCTLHCTALHCTALHCTAHWGLVSELNSLYLQTKRLVISGFCGQISPVLSRSTLYIWIYARSSEGRCSMMAPP
jgi:hypothetical protein